MTSTHSSNESLAASDNPLLAERDIPLFSAIRPEHVSPAVDYLIERFELAREQVLATDSTVDFNSFSAVLDTASEALGFAWGTVLHLQSVCDTPELRAAVSESHPKVAALYAKHSSDVRLYEHCKRILAEQGALLSSAQKKALENWLRDLRMSGAELDETAKVRFSEVQQRLMLLGQEFSNRLLDATDSFVHWASDAELDGVPEEFRTMMSGANPNGEKLGDWRVSLHQPSMMPVMKFANNRSLREALYRASATRASEFGDPEQDNGPIIDEVMALRHELADMLGCSNYAEVSLTPKMASTSDQVLAFLHNIGNRSKPKAESELSELQAFARLNLGIEKLEPWDIAFVSEKLRQETYDFSEQEVMRYFELDGVLSGIFSVSEELFGIKIRSSVKSSWHGDVRAFTVEKDGVHLGKFLLDPYARPRKQGGAWMSGVRPRWKRPDGSLRTATAYLVTNFAAPSAGNPALLTHGDVVTLFHEFGHALHFLLSKIDVLGVSGLSGVEWDAVELPSQLMENFAWDWEVLSRITAHAETGEALPRALYERMIAARRFIGGIAILRQVELSLFDMRLHAERKYSASAQLLADEVRAQMSIIAVPSYNRFQNGFSHVFSGGYAAGYYSYLWAEVLACDAWEVFQEAGGVDPKVGQAYLTSILEVGGSRSMNESFKSFVGREPSIDALLRQRGLVAQ